MVARNTRNTFNVTKAGLAALTLFCLAGTTAMAQSSKSSSKSPTKAAPAAPAADAPPPMPAAPKSAGASNGKPIVHAGDKGGADRDPLAGQKADEKKKIAVDENLIVDLHVNDEDLINVLQMLSIQSQKSILTSKNVSATVTANLYGVTFYEALDAILHVNGYGYIERGNFIFVYTLDELQKIAEQQRQRVWKTVKLNYLNATDAAEFVKPLLSEGGQIKTNGKTPNFSISENAPTGADEFAHGATMLVFDYEENLGEIEKVVKELDTKPAQVLVEATILQTALTEANAFGVDFSLISDLNFSDFVNLGGPLKTVDGLISGGKSSSGGSSGGSGSTTSLPGSGGKGGAVNITPGNTAGPGTLKLGVVYNDVAAFVRMLDQVSDTQIISRPNILTLNRQPARVLVGRKVGYLNTTSTDTATTQTVEFLDTGTQLYFRPFVSSDGSIRMELKPKVSEAVIRNVTDSKGNTVTIPDENTNELTTNVVVKDGNTVVLGGLFREQTQSNRSQVPWAGDIPVIGAAFRGHDDATARNEIIFMITPSIVNDNVLLDQGKKAEATVDRVRTGSREGLLPWSREKQAQKLLVEATDLARDGKREEALWKVQRSLALHHNQPDALQLREALMNKKEQWPTRSVQDEIVHNDLQKKIDKFAPAVGMPQSKAPATTPQPMSATPASNEPAPAEPQAFVNDTTPVANQEEASDTSMDAMSTEPETVSDEQTVNEDGTVEVVVNPTAPTAAPAATPAATTPANPAPTTAGTSAPAATSTTAPSAGLTANSTQPASVPSISAMWKSFEASRKVQPSKTAPAKTQATTTNPTAVTNAPTDPNANR